MARKPIGTAVANYDAEMAEAAAAYAKQEAHTGGGKNFSLKGGILSFDGAAIPGNEMCVIIVDSILESTYYDVDYDPDSPASPVCFAMGRDEETMAPHENVDGEGFERQNDTCRGCPKNEFGSAERGRGKACRNSRKLALLSAGTFSKKTGLELIEDPEHFKKTEIAFLKLPVTSVRAFVLYVKSIVQQFKKPPYGVYTRISVLPDPKTQHRVEFELVDEVGKDCIPALVARNKEAMQNIVVPYSANVAQVESAPRNKAKFSRAGKKTAPKLPAKKTAPKLPAKKTTRR